MVGDATHLSTDTKLLYSAHTSSSLWDVVEAAFVHPPDELRSHRVAVFEPDEDGLLAEAEDGQARLRVTAVVSQTDVLAYLHRNQGQVPGLWATPVAALGLGQRPVVSVPSDMPTIHAFAAMVSSGVRAVGVVDAHGGHGQLVGSLSPADLRGMLPEDAALLALPVLAFLCRASQRADGWAAMRSLAARYGVKSPELQPTDGGGAPVVACSPGVCRCICVSGSEYPFSWSTHTASSPLTRLAAAPAEHLWGGGRGAGEPPHPPRLPLGRRAAAGGGGQRERPLSVHRPLTHDAELL